MKITVIHYSFEVENSIVETMVVNPQYPQELDSILQDAGVSKISEESANKAVENGAIDLRLQ